MLKLGLVVFEGCYLSSLSGLMDAFHVANAHIRNQQGANARQFSWQTVAQTVGRIPVDRPPETNGSRFIVLAEIRKYRRVPPKCQ